LTFLSLLADYAQATDTLERALRRYPECIEALVILASIHTRLAFTHQSSTDSLTERKKAKEVYEQALRLLGTTAKDSQNDSSDVKPSVASASVTAISNDPHIFIELARLWSDDPDLDRSLKSYKEAARVYSVELESPVPAQLSNDIAVLELHQGQAIAAINMLEDALPAVAMAVNEQEGALSIGLDSTFTTLTYNLGVIYEAIGDLDKAKMTYDVLLQRHPEFVDGMSLHLVLIPEEEN
jgi:RNA polymerase-associated protein CTR9